MQEVPECDRILLNKAFAVAKSVPRQTNRAKWRERSGFTPNLLSERSAPGMIRAQYLVCCKTMIDSMGNKHFIIDVNRVQTASLPEIIFPS